MGKVLKSIYGPVLGLAVDGSKGLVQGLGNASTAFFGGPVAALVSIGSALLQPGAKRSTSPTASIDRLRAGVDPRATRKIVFGRTAANTDVHYQEFTGSAQDTLNTIITMASHAMQSIDEIWFDEKLAWSAAGGVSAAFSGYLTVTTRTEGTAANALTITGSTTWTAASSRLVGNAYVWLRYTLSGSASPFASNVTSRITIRSRGAKMYDPRRDSTAGG